MSNKSHTMKFPTKNTSVHQVNLFSFGAKKNAIVTSNTKWARFATPRSQKEKEGLGHVIGQDKSVIGTGITILVLYVFFDSKSLYCMKML